MFAHTKNYPALNRLYPKKQFEIKEVHVPGEGWVRITILFTRHDNLQKVKTVWEQLEVLKELGYLSVSMKVTSNPFQPGGIITDFKISELV